MSDSDLSQMGASKVTLVMNDNGHPVIEKCPVGDIEFAFYHNTAMTLNLAGIRTPKLLSCDAISNKLCLEYIPHQVKQEAVASDEAIAMLARLHQYPPDAKWRYHPHAWSTFSLEESLLLLALPEKNAQQLRYFHQYSDVLFNGSSLISGDTNAGNWGRRDNGDLVLFDWERFGTGSPAIDLAPLIKGMGTKPMYIELAKRYCHHSNYYDFNILAREIAIAKAWIVTEVIMLLNRRQKSAFPLYLNWYRENLPDWLDDLVDTI